MSEKIKQARLKEIDRNIREGMQCSCKIMQNLFTACFDLRKKFNSEQLIFGETGYSFECWHERKQFVLQNEEYFFFQNVAEHSIGFQEKDTKFFIMGIDKIDSQNNLIEIDYEFVDNERNLSYSGWLTADSGGSKCNSPVNTSLSEIDQKLDRYETVNYALNSRIQEMKSVLTEEIGEYFPNDFIDQI